MISTRSVVGNGLAFVKPCFTSVPRVLASFVGLSFAVLTGIVIYRMYFHPLAKYPGPFIGRFTSLRGAYHGWIGDFATDMIEQHNKYGPVVRYSPNYLVFNTPEAFQQIYGGKSKLPKSDSYRVLAQKTDSVLTLRDPAAHRVRRQRVAQALGDENARNFERSFQSHIDKFIDRMADKETKQWSEVRNMSKWCSYLGFDMMMSLVFDSPLKLIEQTKNRHIPEAIHTAARRQSMYFHSIKLAIIALLKLDENILIEEVKARDAFVGFLKQLLKARHKRSLLEDAPTNDVYSHLKRPSKKTDEHLTAGQLNAECANLIVAGSDTTSTTLTGALFYLSRCPGPYKKAAEEVRSKFATVDDINVKDAMQCQYLKACIQETLRMSPPVGTPVPRTVVNDGHEIDGHVMKSGVWVGVGILSLHRNAANFTDPHTFRPERFMPDFDGETDIKEHNMQAYGPFQIGTRSCVGKGVAMQELMLALSRIFFSLDFKAVDEDGEVVILEGKQEKPILGYNDVPLCEFITAVASGTYLRWKARDVPAAVTV